MTYGGGATWDLPTKRYDHEEITEWCKENLTKGAWLIGEPFMGVFEAVIGEATDAMAFRLRWL